MLRERVLIFKSQIRRNAMQWLVYPSVVLLVLIACGLAHAAPVTIKNPKNLPANEEQITTLYMMVCQEVAKSFHIRDYKKLEYSLTLVLGEERERYEIDHATGVGTIYLQKWDETRFAGSAAMIAFHHVLSDEEFRVVVMKSLKRFQNTRPLTVTEAREAR